MRQPRVFVVEAGDFLYSTGERGPRCVVIASGPTAMIQTRCAIEALEECLGLLRINLAELEQEKEEHRRLFPHWYDADGDLARPRTAAQDEDEDRMRRYWHARGEAS